MELKRETCSVAWAKWKWKDNPASNDRRIGNPNAGDIFIDGKRVNDIPAAKRGIGFVFQSYALFRYMTVFDNIAFGLEIAKCRRNRSKNEF